MANGKKKKKFVPIVNQKVDKKTNTGKDVWRIALVIWGPFTILLLSPSSVDNEHLEISIWCTCNQLNVLLY
jgi:hypothetical protein